jgi:hypothetical protein
MHPQAPALLLCIKDSSLTLTSSPDHILGAHGYENILSELRHEQQAHHGIEFYGFQVRKIPNRLGPSGEIIRSRSVQDAVNDLQHLNAAVSDMSDTWLTAILYDW